ncbi:MAG: GntR family transcriptional regulator [Planctomycetes bacterium]|nr:GntR family transcriptional regulator [Planctomycetota bacterium]
MDVVEKSPVRAKVATILREAILSGEFTAGSELSLTETAHLLRVSRTPVREAFQVLEAEGLLELRMNRGAIVKPINTKFITDHFDMRRMLEGEAVFRAIANRMASAPLRTLQQTIITQADVPDDVYDEYNYSFHKTIWVASDNQKLFTMLDTLWNGPSYSHTRGRQVDHRASIREHGAILDCVDAGKAELARAIMHDHIERSMRIILDARKT